MKKENTKESKEVKNLEIGKDYISNSGKRTTIDRKGDSNNNGFRTDDFAGNIICRHPSFWREATPKEVKERFEAHLVKRYGADWKTMKIKESHPSLSSSIEINNGLWDVEISKNWDVEILKEYGSWNVWNKNGLLYREGVWVERLEDEEINIKASETQIGGKHYSEMAIQPIEFIHKNNLSFIQGNIIKYVCRYKSKGGIEDLQKAKHYIDLLIELEGEE